MASRKRRLDEIVRNGAQGPWEVARITRAARRLADPDIQRRAARFAAERAAGLQVSA